MARTNTAATRVKAVAPQPVRLRVLARTEVSSHFVRITLGGGDIEKFTPLGFDQWFRLFLPVSDRSLDKVPDSVDIAGYLRLLMTSKSVRPVVRNYTVRAFRADAPKGPELDIDFVVHDMPEGSAAGPAANWSSSCRVGDEVAIFDEGITFNPPPECRRYLLVADETGLPAVEGILGSLPESAQGDVVVEVPTAFDQRELAGPPGVTVTWVVRDGAAGSEALLPGAAELAAVEGLPVPGSDVYAWVVGESGLATGARRHWVRAGVPKRHIMFSGYWKAGRAH